MAHRKQYFNTPPAGMKFEEPKVRHYYDLHPELLPKRTIYARGPYGDCLVTPTSHDEMGLPLLPEGWFCLGPVPEDSPLPPYKGHIGMPTKNNLHPPPMPVQVDYCEEMFKSFFPYNDHAYQVITSHHPFYGTNDFTPLRDYRVPFPPPGFSVNTRTVDQQRYHNDLYRSVDSTKSIIKTVHFQYVRKTEILLDEEKRLKDELKDLNKEEEEKKEMLEGLNEELSYLKKKIYNTSYKKQEEQKAQKLTLEQNESADEERRKREEKENLGISPLPATLVQFRNSILSKMESQHIASLLEQEEINEQLHKKKRELFAKQETLDLLYYELHRAMIQNRSPELTDRFFMDHGDRERKIEVLQILLKNHKASEEELSKALDKEKEDLARCTTRKSMYIRTTGEAINHFFDKARNTEKEFEKCLKNWPELEKYYNESKKL